MATTPQPIIASVVRSVCGAAGELTRLTAGGLNETYRVDFSARAPVVVRVARRAEPWFTNEAAAINRARVAGIPAPEVLGVEHLEHDDELLSFSVLEMLPGQPLDEIADDLSASELERVVNDAGEMLARLHGVDLSSVDASSNDASNTGALNNAVEPLAPQLLVLPAEDVVGRAVGAARNVAGDEAGAVVDRGVELFAHRLAAASRQPRVLAHGDWLPKHFMMRDGDIVGVIDWEFATAAPAAFDLAHWEVAAGPLLRDRCDWLHSGYARVSDSDAASEWMLPYALHFALDVLGWRNPASVERQRHCVDVITRHVHS